MLKQLFLSSLAVSMLAGCAGGTDEFQIPGRTTTPPTTGLSSVTTATIQGKVTSTAGDVISNADISVGSLTTKTNEGGFFSLANVPVATHLMVNASHADFTDNSRELSLSENSVARVDMQLGVVGGTRDFDSNAGVTMQARGATVTLPANGYIDASGAAYNGQVTVKSSYFDITTDEGKAAFPGTYQGRQVDGSTTGLVSYGFIDVTLTDSQGNPLNLAANEMAQMSLPAITGLDKPDSIPLWYYDIQEEIWVREGTANYDAASNTYFAEVAHFTAWNLDVPADRTSTVTGCVVNETGQPVTNARAEASGINWTNGDLQTDAQGNFEIPVIANQSFRLSAVKNASVATSAEKYTVPAGDTLNVSECLVLRAPAMTITLTWDEHPYDLDAHLVVERIGDTEKEIYYSNDREGDIFLDTDDRQSYGPEVITVGELTDGVYTYGVKHYEGESNLSDSDLTVSLVIDGQLTRTLSAPTGAVGSDDYWTAWRINVNAGEVTIEEVNEIAINDSLHKMRVKKSK